MSQMPDDLRYTASHEWVRDIDNGMVSVGITDYAQSQMGDLVFIELPEVGMNVSAGDEIAVVESVKTASDVYSPVTGQVVEINESLITDPGKVNHSPFTEGWLYKIKLPVNAKFDHLLTLAEYQAQMHQE